MKRSEENRICQYCSKFKDRRKTEWYTVFLKSRTFSVLAVLNIKKVYEEKKPFRVIKVGGNYRIIKSSFDKWFNIS